MQSHKLTLDDVEEEHFQLVAIYCPIEEHKMAYLINKHLTLQLERTRQDLDFNYKEMSAYYAHFIFNDPTNYRTYHLVSNKFKGQPRKVLSSGSLFVEEEVRPLEVNLIPEYKKVDFFLKIEEDMESSKLNKLVNIISQIPQVIAVNKINVDGLKSKQNLIFE